MLFARDSKETLWELLFMCCAQFSYPELAERRNNSAFAALLLQVGNLSCMAGEKK